VTVLVASDWHLSPESPPLHGRLARAFLARARARGATVVLNGDILEDLFSGPERAAAAHPLVVAEIAALAREGRLRRTRGNHDPAAGEERVVLEVPGVGRVLVAHGDEADPLSRSALGRLGDAISRRAGRLSPVRAAARLAERLARGLAEERMVALFRERCLPLVAREGCALGVFGHVHRAHAARGDPYANAGALAEGSLSYVALDGGGLRLCELRASDLAPRELAGIKPAEMG
jgi:UDP-2,3-diacylglucosamine pyrophosphatase LpxH